MRPHNWANEDVPFCTLQGQTLVSVERGKLDDSHYGSGEDCILFVTETGKEYMMLHHRGCCESVEIEDINGDLADLAGAYVTVAEEATNNENPPESEWGPPESFTWTFYKIQTPRGDVTVRWFGQSNGYYSESVSFQEVPNADQ